MASPASVLSTNGHLDIHRSIGIWIPENVFPGPLFLQVSREERDHSQ